MATPVCGSKTTNNYTSVKFRWMFDACSNLVSDPTCRKEAEQRRVFFFGGGEI